MINIVLPFWCLEICTDAIVFTQSATLYQKVSTTSFDMQFAIAGNDVCLEFASLPSLPDANAFEVCIGMHVPFHYFRQRVFAPF
jgi:hypothetical protein